MAVSQRLVEGTVGRPLTIAEQGQSRLWIEQAKTIIQARAVREGTTLEDLDQGILDMVITEAVADRIRRPNDATEMSVQIDDGQVTRRYESATGQIHIRDEWWELLFPTASFSAFSIRTVMDPVVP